MNPKLSTSTYQYGRKEMNTLESISVTKYLQKIRVVCLFVCFPSFVVDLNDIKKRIMFL